MSSISRTFVMEVCLIIVLERDDEMVMRGFRMYIMISYFFSAKISYPFPISLLSLLFPTIDSEPFLPFSRASFSYRSFPHQHL
jgi:hypothetical protein